MKLFKSKRQKLKEECWNLDYELIKWLNEHLKVFLEDSSNVVKWEKDEYTYKGETTSMDKLITQLIVITKDLLKDYDEMDFSQRTIDLKDDMYSILKVIHFGLWW